MGLRINQNIMAFSAYRNLSVTDGQLSKSLEKLSSGFRINRAADDAAGLVISEGLRSQVNGLKVATRNAQDGISVVQTAEGALNEVHAILQRMRDLAVQAANTGSNDANATAAAQTEVSALKSELDRISSSTKFGTMNLLDGTFGAAYSKTGSGINFGSGVAVVNGTNDEFTVDVGAGAVTVDVAAGTYSTTSDLQDALNAALTAASITTVTAVVTDTAGVVKVGFQSSATFTLGAGTNDVLADLGGTAGAAAQTGTGGVFQVGANNSASDQISVAINAVSSAALGVGGVDVQAAAATAITTIDTAISSVSTQRATLGAYQNRFEHTIANLNVATENLSASESRIRDTDMAQEMVQFTRSQILLQAGTAMLAQANQVPQSVLKLLQ